MHSNINLCIFDIDGVLVDSAEANYISLDTACKEVFGISVSRKFEEEMGSIPSSEKIKLILSKNRINPTTESITEFSVKKFQALLNFFHLVKFNKEVPEIFQFLKSKGIKTAIVSNARKEYVDLIIDKFKIDALVDFSIGSSCGLKPKPNPAMYLFAMSQLGVSPKDTLIFEDSQVGIEAAKKSCASVVEIKRFSNLTTALIEGLV